MPTCSVDQAEAVRRYYAAFPALKKGEESPLQYYMPPPAWCRKQVDVDADMHPDAEPQAVRDWNNRMRKERRNSYHGPRNRGKKRFAQAAYSRSFDGKETLPEWVTHEGVWDMEEQDPVREFIRAIALDEGYGTCENTVMEELRAPVLRLDRDPPPPVPDWDQVPALGADWLLAEALAPGAPPPDHEDELYAQFEAKFDRSLEALWDRERDQATPDDDYQDLPIDFTELLSSPSDRMFDSVGAPPALATVAPPALDPLASLSSLASLPSLGSAVWSCSAAPARPSPPLHARLRPLRLASPPPPLAPPPPPPPPELESFALLEGDELYDALSTVASTMRSFAAINHSRDTSGFYEVQPRRAVAAPPPPPPPRAAPSPLASEPKEDLLTSARTHFRPIKREGSVEAERTRYVDGDTFDIRGSLEPVSFRRSSSGGEYLATGEGERYLEYRAGSRERGIDYGRLELTQAQSAALARTALPLRFPLRQHDVGVQTDPVEEPPPPAPPQGGTDEVTPASEVIAPDGPGPAELEPRDWEELLADIRLAHAMYAAGGGGGGTGEGRKRRHSAALRCARHCPHPHARFLPCCAHLRPLTR